MDLATAQELLRNPRELTREQWTEAYLAIQQHNIWSGGRAADDDSDPGGAPVDD